MRASLDRQTASAKPTPLNRALDQAAMFFAASLFVLLLIATYGIDLSPGLF